MEFFDSHAHLADERFDEDLQNVLDKMKVEGVSRAIEVACDLRETEKSLMLAQAYPFINVAVGMHPQEASDMTMELLDKLREIVKHPKVCAIGEIGLDYHYDTSPRDAQKKWFALQLELAIELDMPVVLHIRDAFGDAMDILRRHRGKFRGVMHCYGGSLETAHECLDMGMYIAFGGAITFKNASKLSSVAARLPLDRLLLETDCPYLTPEPYRGQRNDPSFVPLVAKKLAELSGESVENVARITYRNALDCFSLKG